MNDPFEESLRDLLNARATEHDDEVTLGRVLKTANRQVGAAELFGLAGHWFEAVMLALNSGGKHISPVSSRTASLQRSADKG